MAWGSAPTRSLNVIWRRRVLDQLLEASFIRWVLFSKLPHPVRWIAVEDGAELPLMDDVLVCSFGDPSDYLGRLRNAGHVNIGAFHLGDETGGDSTDFYAACDYVLRHYWVPDRFAPGDHPSTPVIWAPNGWAKGVGPRRTESQLDIAARDHEIFFAGFVGTQGSAISERTAMLDALQTHRIPATVILSQEFAQGLGGASYGAYMENAKLALAPGGNAPETIRFYDALECGAVPVVLDRPWLHATEAAGAVGPCPAVILQSWLEIPEATALLGEAGHEQLAARHMACAAWWADLKTHAAARVAETIEAAFARRSDAR